MTDQPSGLRVRDILVETQIIDGVERTVPVLDQHDREIELSSIDVPIAIEAAGGDAIEAHVLELRTAPAPPDVAEGSPTPPTDAEGQE